MITLLFLAAAAAWLYTRWTRRPRTGAGSSCDARARQLRTPAVRVADTLNIPTQRGALARRAEIGAEGERATAALIDPLHRRGWVIMHSLALPTGRTDVDHLAISPTGTVILPDTKKWPSRYRVRVHGGRLYHGAHDVTDRLNGLRRGAAAVSTALKVPVIPLVVMHGAPIEGGELTVDGIRIIPADRVADVLDRLGRARTGYNPHALADRARTHFPPYTRKHR
ncbi:nuclease-related domain-containing protein [Streptomyces sp. NPDC093108]|uniref:nuclease-related domain-containing protein n=1 Tax=unclassified Streptomyces TaxID=2593676 RepID=UPI003818FC4B